MRPRRLALPLGFGLLGVAYALPALVVFRYPSVLAVSLGAAVGTLVGAVVWAGSLGDNPSPSRGALVGVLTTLTGGLLAGPVLLVPSVVATGGVPPLDTLLGVVAVTTVVTVLVALGSLPFAVALGLAATRWPEFAFSAADLPSWATKPSSAESCARQLGVVVAVLTLACLGGGVVQYADPTTPTVGDAPVYAGADAPAAQQVAQAQARTRAVSHTLTTTSTAYRESGTVVSGTQSITAEHDRTRDLVRLVFRADGSVPQTTLLTEDGVWQWSSATTTPATDAVDAQSPPYAMGRLYRISAVTDAPARVVNVTDDTATVRYPTPATADGYPVDRLGNRTVIIDRESGRLRSIETVRVDNEHRYVVRTTRFSDYESTSVDRPSTPARPLRWHLYDLLHGPLNGGTPLHDD